MKIYSRNSVPVYNNIAKTDYVQIWKFADKGRSVPAHLARVSAQIFSFVRSVHLVLTETVLRIFVTTKICVKWLKICIHYRWRNFFITIQNACDTLTKLLPDREWCIPANHRACLLKSTPFEGNPIRNIVKLVHRCPFECAAFRSASSLFFHNGKVTRLSDNSTSYVYLDTSSCRIHSSAGSFPSSC